MTTARMGHLELLCKVARPDHTGFPREEGPMTQPASRTSIIQDPTWSEDSYRVHW